jgi:predicted RNA methylase
MGEVLLEQMDGKLSFIARNGLKEHHLSYWQYQQPSSPSQEFIALENHVETNVGPPQVLDLGCGSGSWCFTAKSENPNWIVHGIDDSNHWLCVHKGVTIRFGDTTQ